MELFLNVVWLLAAALIVGCGVLHHDEWEGKRRSLPAVLVVLSCIVVLLFPVISASDDLHTVSIVCEDASRKIGVAATAQPHSVTFFLLAVALTIALRFRSFRFGLVSLHDIAAVERSGFASAVSQRGPPPSF